MSQEVNAAVGAAVIRLLELGGAGPEEPRTLEETAALWAVEGARVVPGTQCVISVVIAERPDMFRVIAGSGDWARELVGQEWPLNAGMLHGRAMYGGQPLETSNAPEESAAPWVFANRIHSGRLVPIGGAEPLPDGRIGMGVIGFWRESREPFSEVERKVIDTYGRLVGLGMLRSESRVATARLVDRLRVASQVAEDFSSSLDLEQVVDIIVQRVAEFIRADRITLLSVHDDHVEVVGAFDSGGPAARVGAHAPITDRLRAVAEGGRVQVEGRPDLRGTSSEMRAQLRGVKHRVTVPLAAGGRVVAIMTVMRRFDEVFSGLDIDHLTQIGSRAALALQNSRLYAESKRSQVKALDALIQISRHLEVAGSTPEFFSRLARTIAELVSAERVAFWRLSEDQHSVEIADGTYGIDGELARRIPPLPVNPSGDGIAERILFQGHVFRGAVVTPGPQFGEYLSALDGLGARDAIALAWKAGDTVLGSVSVYNSTRAGGFTDEDTWTLQLAALAAGLVWQLKATQQRLHEMDAAETTLLRQHMERMRDLEQLKSDFLKLASHELRGPLTVVKGYHSMIAERALDAEHIDRVMPIVEGKLDQMTRLINEMLETARLEDGTAYLERRPQDIRPLLQMAVTSIRPLLGPSHRLTLRMKSSPAIVDVDADRVTTIVTNLLDNAVKFSPNGGRIRCQMTTTATMVRVHVSDDGLGIASADLPRLFTRFGRLVTPDNSHISGTGLGLYISKELARLHGGEITVRSSPRRGTRFILSLPLAVAPSPGATLGPELNGHSRARRSPAPRPAGGPAGR